jgi:hypothetical protein
MSDEPFHFAISPAVTERNARCLIDIMARCFPGGVRSGDLRIRFEEITCLKRQMYYDTIAYARYRRWIVGGGHSKLFQLNPDGSWRPTQTAAGQKLEKDRLEYLVDSQTQQIGELNDEVARLRDWVSSGDTNGATVALSSLVQIVGDNTVSPRQRIRAAAAVLSYKTQDDVVTEFVKNYLGSVCASTDVAIDYKIEAGELLRRHEAPRVTPETVRPSYDGDGAEADRIAAWRHYEKLQLRYQIAMETRDVPPPGWADEIDCDTYVAPEPGWPPKIRLPSSS